MNNNSNSGYWNLILNTEHYKNREKRNHLNTLERYHICKTSKDRLHMNDTYIDTHNLNGVHPVVYSSLKEYDLRQSTQK
jgi:hypothetical protein